MINDRNLFDEFEANRRKNRGMKIAAESRNELLAVAQQIAIEIGKTQKFVTMDDVYKLMLLRGLPPQQLGNASGSVFKNQRIWIWSGQVRKSHRVSTHGHLQRLWELL
ncbi:hypothetical protein UFOVP1480_38 [uncultured Caudovirales phage]|uniref:Uncharacterized protein n=2 Tax=uncultured Caudovirales phage TaxID=2100421 RepID=A0A6J5S609_9CAUD|nr:hypothetical protein UFOVP1391_21 [uncultured Caudovirales phage]CAB4215669.1 hypothetical protein UFOVP1480_38 [uncultured Caudovirales phage]CAB5229778.1 hypothetical protein UFOVP1568_14 [uncultured Caudovirales phage]